MNAVPTPDAPSRRRWWLPALAGVLAAAVLGAAGWYLAGQRQALRAEQELQATRLQGLEDSLRALRADQRANARALQDAASGNRVLRDELLGLAQRSALLEQTVEQLSADTRQGLQVLRQEEAEVLLVQARQRLELAHDLDGARRLYAVAETLLDPLPGADRLNLRQALLQERQALEALGEDPRRALARQLDATLAALLRLEQHPAPAPAASLSWWQRLLSPLVEIHPSHTALPLAAGQRQQAIDSLQLEATLARAALERGDRPAWQAALGRIDDWVVRLWPDGADRQRHRQALARLRQATLSPSVPELGTTLQLLRQLRSGSTPP